jgi:5-dehydro-4-deoxyglucarate dehydratase
LSIGVQAYTSSISNVAPKLAVELARVGGLLPSAKGPAKFAKLTPLMRKYVHPLYALREKVKGYEVSVMKAMMDRAGLAGGPVRPPLEDTRADHLAEVEKLVELYRPWL